MFLRSVACHQIPHRPATRQMQALRANDARHPWCRIIAVTSPGVSPPPKPTPAKIRAFALPRSPTGNQRSTNWLLAGYIVASPAPSEKRIATRSSKALPACLRNHRRQHDEQSPTTCPALSGCGAAPSRRASTPAGIWKPAYPTRNALKIQPRRTLLIANSWPFRYPQSRHWSGPDRPPCSAPSARAPARTERATFRGSLNSSLT